MTYEELLEYLEQEEQPETYCGEIIEVPDDVLEDTLGDAFPLATEEELLDIRQKVLQDMKELVEKSLARLILRHSSHIRKRLEEE